MHGFFSNKYIWTNAVLESICWEAHGKALISLSDGARTRIQKFIHNRLPCNHRESRYYDYRSPNSIACTPT
jgi:hypothetical protein